MDDNRIILTRLLQLKFSQQSHFTLFVSVDNDRAIRLYDQCAEVRIIERNGDV